MLMDFHHRVYLGHIQGYICKISGYACSKHCRYIKCCCFQSISRVYQFLHVSRPFLSSLLSLKIHLKQRLDSLKKTKEKLQRMSTLPTAIPTSSSHPALIIPPLDLTLTYSSLDKLVHNFQCSLASIGVSPTDAVSISLANTLEFIVAFLAVGAQRAVAAPLNPNYKQEEFEFYINDLKSKLVIVPPGSVVESTPVVRAARKFGAGIAEVKWDGHGEVALELKEKGDALGSKEVEVAVPTEDDVALVLHTSGTTGRPKAVRAIPYIFQPPSRPTTLLTTLDC